MNLYKNISQWLSFHVKSKYHYIFEKWKIELDSNFGSIWLQDVIKNLHYLPISQCDCRHQGPCMSIPILATKNYRKQTGWCDLLCYGVSKNANTNYEKWKNKKFKHTYIDVV